MKRAIAVDTSTDCLYISARDESGRVYSFSQVNRNHSENLLTELKKLLKEANLNAIDEIYVTKGPGSFTGLRISISVAKGISSALDIPIFTLSTLDAYAYSSLFIVREKLRKFNDAKKPPKVYLVPLIDAKKDRYYSSILSLNSDGKLDKILDDSDISFSSILDELSTLEDGIVFFITANGVEIKKENININKIVDVVFLKDCTNPSKVLFDCSCKALEYSDGPVYIRAFDAVEYKR